MGVRINGVWHEELPDPGNGGTDSGNGRSFDNPNAYNSAAGGTWGPQAPNANGGGGGGGGGNGDGGGGGGITKEDLDAQFQKLLAALASGNKEAFEFEKQKFNEQFAESQRQFNQQFGEGQRQFDITNGQRNLDRQVGLGTTLLNAATQLRGPRDYLQYQALTHGGQGLMQQLQSSQQLPQTNAPQGLQSISIADVLRQIGMLPGGGMQQAPSAPLATADAGGAVGINDRFTPQQAIMRRFGATAGQPQLNPNQINPARWDEMGPVGQDLTKNLAETNYGYDAADFERMINQNRPMGAAPRAVATSYGKAGGLL